MPIYIRSIGYHINRAYFKQDLQLTKAGNRRAKRGGSRKYEVRVEPSEADAFMDFRTRFCYSGIMISKFYCLTSISPKDNIQFEGLHHKVGNKERVLLKFLKLTFW